MSGKYKTYDANNGPVSQGDRHQIKNLSRSCSVKRRDMPKTNTIGELVMSKLRNRKKFTGQVTIDIHCKNGMICDVKQTIKSSDLFDFLG